MKRMTERNAAIFANKVYKAFHAGAIPAPEAIALLRKVAPYMSIAQTYKMRDFVDCYKYVR